MAPNGEMLPVVSERSATTGKAAVLAIGTATAPHQLEQSNLTDEYFRVTNSDHMVELKEKFRRICKCP